jgi:hypothetical protein
MSYKPYKIAFEERDKALALTTSAEFRAEVAANYAKSAARNNELIRADPFPQPDRHEFYGLQPVKKDWTDLQRVWRVKKGVFLGGLIFASVSMYGDRLWYHVSFSLCDRIPSYEQTAWVRQTIFSPTLKVLQIFPPLDEHYSFHPNCLHLWACLEEDLLPDFRTMGVV